MSRARGTGEQFIMHLREMRESPAWRALEHNDWLILQALELEHMRHGGAENGNLTCSYTHFVSLGVRKQSIRRALSRLTALGFIETTKVGFRAARGFQKPSSYRVTYLNRPKGKIAGTSPTNEWRKHETDADVALALTKAGVPNNVRTTPVARTKNTVPPGDIEVSCASAPNVPPHIGAVSAPNKRAA